MVTMSRKSSVLQPAKTVSKALTPDMRRMRVNTDHTDQSKAECAPLAGTRRTPFATDLFPLLADRSINDATGEEVEAAAQI